MMRLRSSAGKAARSCFTPPRAQKVQRALPAESLPGTSKEPQKSFGGERTCVRRRVFLDAHYFAGGFGLALVGCAAGWRCGGSMALSSHAVYHMSASICAPAA